MLDSELAGMVEGLRRLGRDDVGLEVKLASTKSLPERTAQAMCAFANTPGGGVLILGLDESAGFTTVGCEHAGKLAADLAGLCRKDLEPPLTPRISQPLFEGKILVVAEVPELDVADKPCHLANRGQANGSFIRLADGNRQLTSYEVTQLVANRGQPVFDCEAVEESSYEDFDDEIVRDFLIHIRRSRPNLAKRSDEDLLKRFRILVRHEADRDHFVPSISGLLAFGRDPQEFAKLRGCSVTVTTYPTRRKGEPGPDGARFIDDKVIEGPLPILLEDVLAVLLARMSRQGMISGIGRADQWEYPLAALREIIVNAVVHRDYGPMARGTRVQVELYPDRLEIISPGGLYGPVSIERLGDDGIASTRNRVLMDILENTRFRRDQGFMCEGRATGIPTVMASLREAGRVPATFADRIKDFRVILPNGMLLDEETRRWIFSLGERSLTADQQMALALLRTGRALTVDEYRLELGVDGGVARARLADLARRKLVRAVNQRRWVRYTLDDRRNDEATPDLFSDVEAPPPTHEELANPSNERDTLTQRKALILDFLLSGPRSKAEIAEMLGLSDQQARYALKLLIADGKVLTTEPPRSPKLRYRLNDR